MFFKIILKLIYKYLINLSLYIYLLSDVILQKIRSLSGLINRAANKIFFRKKYNNKINFSKKQIKIKNDLSYSFVDNLYSDPIEYESKFITPLFPYIICDHYLSKELDKNSKYFMFTNIKIKGNDLFKNNYINKIKNFDIVLVQVNFFDFFHDNILPYLEINNLKIILITCQFHFPSLYKNFRTENCINSPSIILWISQNPIYCDKSNYLGIPYGLDHRNLKSYINYLKIFDKQNIKKPKEVINLYSNPHPGHLSKNHFRTKYKKILCDEKRKMAYGDYLKEISLAKFLISPTGDREDCYRHYEAIGLETIPISNASKIFYKSIFKKNMIFLEEKEIINIINSLESYLKYKIPKREILLNSYWINKINKKISSILKKGL